MSALPPIPVTQDRPVQDAIAKIIAYAQTLGQKVVANASLADAGLAKELHSRVAFEVSTTTALAINTAAVSTEITVRTTADSALATRIDTVAATTTTADAANAAAITTETTARTNADSALATRVDTLTATTSTSLASNAAAIITEQSARTTAISAEATLRTSLAATTSTSLTANAAAITTEVSTRTTADTALGSRIDSLTVSTSTTAVSNAAAVTSEASARTTADTALGSRIDSVTATANTDRSNTSAAITTEQTARANADTALASRATTLEASVNSVTTGTLANNARIATEETTRATADSANASATSTLTSTVNGHTSTLTTYGSSINGIQAKYGIKLDVSGRVVGWEQINSGTTDSFKIVSSNFQIYDPTLGDTPVFEVSGGLVRIKNGVIGTSNVGTTNLAGNAATNLLAGAGAAGSTAIPYTAVQSSFNGLGVTIASPTGAPVRIDWSAAVSGTGTTSAGGGGFSPGATLFPGFGVSRVQSGVTTAVVAWGFSFGGAGFTVDTPAAGASVTYYLQYGYGIQAEPSPISGAFSNEQMILTEFKR